MSLPDSLRADQRRWLQRHLPTALRLLDAHAADRAALVAQLAAAERRDDIRAEHYRARAEVAEARVRELEAAERQVAELKNQLSVAQAQVKALHTLATEVPDEPTH